MSNKLKRALSSILAFTMVLSMITVMNVSNVFAAETVYTWDFTSSTWFSEAVAANSSVISDQKETDAIMYTNVKLAVNTSNVSDGQVTKQVAKTEATQAQALKITVPKGDKATLSLQLTSGSTGKVITIDDSEGTSVLSMSDYTKNTLKTYSVELTCGETYYLNTSNYKAYLGKVTLTVTSASDDPVESVSINPSTASVNKLGTTTLEATVTPSTANQSVTWSSSDVSIATVDENGVVTGVSVGEAKITATTVGTTSAGEAATVTATVTVNDITEVTGITISGETSVNACGGTTQLSATITPDNATYQTVEWSSSDVSIATVDSTGLVTGVGIGEATITAAATDGSDVSATTTVTVKNASEAKVVSEALKLDLTNYSAAGLTLSGDNENITDGTVFYGYLTAEGGSLTKRTSSSSGIQTGAEEYGMFKFTTDKALQLSVTFCSTGSSNVSDIVVLDSAKEVAAHATVKGTTDKTLTILSLPAGTYYIGSPTSEHGATGAGDTTKENNSTNRGARVKTIEFAEAGDVVTQTAAGTTPATFESGADNSFYVVAVVGADDLENYDSVGFAGTETSADLGVSSDTVYSAVEINGTQYTAEDFGGAEGDYVYAVCIDGENEITQTVRVYAQAMTVVLSTATETE